MLATPEQAARHRRAADALAATQRDAFLSAVQAMPLAKVDMKAIDGEYILTPHDSIEAWSWKIVVTSPAFTTPTWLLPKGRRRATARTAAALGLPSLDHLTLGAAQVFCNEHSTIHRLYQMRRPGTVLAQMKGALVPLPWYT